ncbi:DUF4845 domain-containing protein [Xanthomonas citri]|uniref:DUF4845 domain-containing protein n=1 Tax=Xanthomonas citri TaxID=346 RepID=UPI0009B84025|nr:DUF4845 domain-containing protein [Xanthomonas citri]
MHARRARGSTMKRKQSGMTLTSFVVVLAVVGFGLYIGMKLFPMYQEYYAVRTSMKGLANEAGSADMDPSKLQEMFFKRLDINASESVKRENVKFERIEGGWRMKVNYEARRELVGNLDVVGKFDTAQDLTKRGVE